MMAGTKVLLCLARYNMHICRVDYVSFIRELLENPSPPSVQALDQDLIRGFSAVARLSPHPTSMAGSWGSIYWSRFAEASTLNCGAVVEIR